MNWRMPLTPEQRRVCGERIDFRKHVALTRVSRVLVTDRKW